MHLRRSPEGGGRGPAGKESSSDHTIITITTITTITTTITTITISMLVVFQLSLAYDWW